jgi:hypothetical protein
MIRRIISWYKIWILKREIKSIQVEIDEYYLTLLARNDEFHKVIDIDKHFRRVVKLRDVERRELERQIESLKK